MQTIEQTYEEKVAMYSKLSKEELIAMLIESNRILAMHQTVIVYPAQPFVPAPVQTYPLWPYYGTTCNVELGKF
jgi:hypothetical protein